MATGGPAPTGQASNNSSRMLRRLHHTTQSNDTSRNCVKCISTMLTTTTTISSSDIVPAAAAAAAAAVPATFTPAIIAPLHRHEEHLRDAQPSKTCTSRSDRGAGILLHNARHVLHTGDELHSECPAGGGTGPGAACRWPYEFGAALANICGGPLC
eukprot:108613-Chlamydomonas_euryale.AAC.16